MGVKERKTYNLDSGVVRKYEFICKKKGVKYSEQLEKVLEHFIAKDEEMFVDEIHAPRIEALVENVLNKHTNRLAAMIHNNHVDSKASLIGLPIIYKRLVGLIEAAIRKHINDELLSDVLKEHTLQVKYANDTVVDNMLNSWSAQAKESVIEGNKQARRKNN
ncbi:hypothetical protein [Priestia megaterium]|uniref:hypothetical protein n=1 Tax=Priestia megaterium TaxID=1404 RepID=UPI00278661E5|nr:hypothetical protein [Priestia megaterium]MDQ0808045.1 hypothetical protein [Priestia megaterium]